MEGKGGLPGHLPGCASKTYREAHFLERGASEKVLLLLVAFPDLHACVARAQVGETRPKQVHLFGGTPLEEMGFPEGPGSTFRKMSRKPPFFFLAATGM